MTIADYGRSTQLLVLMPVKSRVLMPWLRSRKGIGHRACVSFCMLSSTLLRLDRRRCPTTTPRNALGACDRRVKNEIDRRFRETVLASS